MASEPNTDILDIDPNQYGKTAAADTAFGAIDAMFGGVLSIADSNSSPYTIPFQSGIDEPIGTKTALRFFKLVVTGSAGGTWTAYMPSGKQKFFLASNQRSTGNLVVKVSGQTGVTLPVKAEAFLFLNGTDVELIRLNGPLTIWTYATLPATPYIGQLEQISDCNTSTFGATAAGSGSTNAMVRWNGSNWTVCGV